MHLKYSNGSKQSLHLYDALHAVEPNSLTTAVFNELQRGHATSRLPCNNSRLLPALAGGAMPYSRSWRIRLFEYLKTDVGVAHFSKWFADHQRRNAT